MSDLCSKFFEETKLETSLLKVLTTRHQTTRDLSFILYILLLSVKCEVHSEFSKIIYRRSIFILSDNIVSPIRLYFEKDPENPPEKTILFNLLMKFYEYTFGKDLEIHKVLLLFAPEDFFSKNYMVSPSNLVYGKLTDLKDVDECIELLRRSGINKDLAPQEKSLLPKVVSPVVVAPVVVPPMCEEFTKPAPANSESLKFALATNIPGYTITEIRDILYQLLLISNCNIITDYSAIEISNSILLLPNGVKSNIRLHCNNVERSYNAKENLFKLLMPFYLEVASIFPEIKQVLYSFASRDFFASNYDAIDPSKLVYGKLDDLKTSKECIDLLLASDLYKAETCSLLSLNGERCSEMTVFKKQNDQNMYCKNYCRQHFNLIIEQFRRRYTNVFIMDQEYKISSTTVIIADKNIDGLEYPEIVELLTSSPNIAVEIIVDIGMTIPHYRDAVIEWGLKRERWISSDWQIDGQNLKYNGTISYIEDFSRKNLEDIQCREKNIELGAKIGEGGYGQVFRVDDLIIKRVELIDDKEDDLMMANLKEACFLAQYSHPLITQIKCIDSRPNSKYMYFHMRDGGQPLDKKISLVKKNIDYILYQLLYLFSEMAELDIVHGDIKPPNITVDDKANITVIDWGAVSLNSRLKNLASNGTRSFMPRESIDLAIYKDEIADIYKEGFITQAERDAALARPSELTIGPINDIYSIGCTILYLYTENYVSIFELYTNLEFLDNYIDFIPEYLRGLIKKMICPVALRLPAKELILDPIFDKFRSIEPLNSYKFNIRPIEEFKSDFLDHQTDLNKAMVVILSHWLAEIHAHIFSFNKQSLPLAIYLVKLYLFKKTDIFPKAKLQLLGCACNFISAFMNYNTFDVSYEAEDWIRLSANAFTKKDFNDMVMDVIKTLNYIVYKPLDLQLDFSFAGEILSENPPKKRKNWTDPKLVELLNNHL